MRLGACIAWIGLVLPVQLAAQPKVQLPARDRILAEKPAALFTVGKEDGQSWEVLSGVRWVAFDARDNLYVLDGNNFRVLVFDPNGKYVRSISREGQGPGELMAPTGMAVTADGALVVSDGGRHAYSLFKSDGTFLRNALYGDGEGVGSVMDGLHAHPRGGVVTQIHKLRRPGRGQLGAPTGEIKVPLRWVDFSAAPGSGTVLYEFTRPSITPKVEPGAGRGVSVTTMLPNWSPAHTFGVLPNGGVAVADEAEYRVKIISPTGKIERIIERAIAPRKGTQKDKDAYVKREAARMAQRVSGPNRTGPGGAAAGGPAITVSRLEQTLRSAAWQDLIPVLRRVSADPQGRVWVARVPDDFGLYGPVDILRADGTYIGTIADALLPDAVSKSGRAAFIERDELGVERVAVKRLPASWQ